jgi:hypothetical protein
MNSNTLKNYNKKKLMIPPCQKKKSYIRSADISREAPSDDRPLKRHENKKQPPPPLSKSQGANLAFQRQAFALPNVCRNTHLEMNFFYAGNKKSYGTFTTCCVISI